MEKTVDEYKNSTDNALVEFAKEVLASDKKNATQKQYVIGEVTTKAAQDIERLVGFDVSNFEHVIDGGHIGHIGKRHGEHGEADQSMKDPEDIGRVKYVLDNYDDIEISGRRNRQFINSDGTLAKVLIYKKRINGNYYVTEVVADAKIKRLRIISMRKSKAETEHDSNYPAVLTSETPSATNNIQNSTTHV
ncbi:MAG: hypothetical protein FWC15_03745 [Fibromonadales bacterium]|nr:hypothetical protein [Fibromonadales bacterium]